MTKLSQTQRVAVFLKAHPQQKFTARQIAEAITREYAADYQHKRAKFADENVFIQQIVAEIGAQKNNIIKACPEIQMQDKPRPRLMIQVSLKKVLLLLKKYPNRIYTLN